MQKFFLMLSAVFLFAMSFSSSLNAGPGHSKLKKEHKQTLRLLQEEQRIKADLEQNLALEQQKNIELTDQLLRFRPAGKSIQIHAKFSVGTTIIIEISLENTVYELKQAIFANGGPAITGHRLFFAGKQLEDERSLSYYNIKDESTIHVVLPLRGKKPVILLYPLKRTKICVDVALTPQWSFSDIHPIVKYSKHLVQWQVMADPVGLMHENREYSYLFWEAKTAVPLFELDCKKAFCIETKSEKMVLFLEDALMRRGLNARERQDMITFWLPEMRQKAYVLIQFIKAEYEQAAKLLIDPMPDELIRVFMVFCGSEEKMGGCLEEDVCEPIDRNNLKNKFLVVEWGGMNLGN